MPIVGCTVTSVMLKDIRIKELFIFAGAGYEMSQQWQCTWSSPWKECYFTSCIFGNKLLPSEYFSYLTEL